MIPQLCVHDRVILVLEYDPVVKWSMTAPVVRALGVIIILIPVFGVGEVNGLEAQDGNTQIHFNCP